MHEVPASFLYGCMKLKEVRNLVKVKKINDKAFSGCSSLEYIDLPEGLDSIKASAFNYCSGLKKFIFPSTVSFLGGQSCVGWKSIESIYCKALVPPECESPFDRSTYNAKLYVPKGSLQAYKTHPVWKNFNGFEELELSEFPTSGIDVVEIDNLPEGKGEVYDLAGRRVVNPVRGQVYIIDGEKKVY